MAKKWSDLSDKQKAKFGDNKAAFKKSKRQTRRQGGNVEKARDIVKTYKRNQAAATPNPAPSQALSLIHISEPTRPY